jgi:hypothetical protein
LLGRRCPVEHWESRVIARVAVLFKYSVTQPSPFSYDNLAFLSFKINLTWLLCTYTIRKKDNTTCWSKLKCVEFRIEIHDIVGRQVNKFARITTSAQLDGVWLVSIFPVRKVNLNFGILISFKEFFYLRISFS